MAGRLGIRMVCWTVVMGGKIKRSSATLRRSGISMGQYRRRERLSGKVGPAKSSARELRQLDRPFRSGLYSFIFNIYTYSTASETNIYSINLQRCQRDISEIPFSSELVQERMFFSFQFA